MSTVQNGKIVTNGLVLSLDAANQKSYPGTGTAWTDLSGNANNGTLTNGPTFSSANGGSIVFDGVDDFVNTTYNQNFSSGFSLIAWFKTSNISAGPIIFKPDSVHQSPNFSNLTRLYINNSILDFLWTNSTGVFYQAKGSINTDVWYNAVGVYNSSNNNITLYLNGNLIQTTSTSGTLKTSSLSYLIGKTDTQNNGYYSGNIANAQIYNRALSSTEVLQNYNAVKSRFGL